MRVISGSCRGLKLKTIEGDSTRPTKDMVKEALFSILSFDIPDSCFLDLFSGSGAIGIEALSRGTKIAYFNDLNKDCIKVIKENLTKARLLEKSIIFNLDYTKLFDKIKDVKFDIIFIDPPYNMGLGINAIEMISSYDLLKINGVIILEADKVEEIPDIIGVYEKTTYKRYGRNSLIFYKRKE